MASSMTDPTNEPLDLAGLKATAAAATQGKWQVSGVRHSGDLKLGRDARLIAAAKEAHG